MRGSIGALARKLSRCAGVIALERIALHMHDTWGRALANVQTGYEAGVRTFDASLGGLGGCPYAPGASGNVVTIFGPAHPLGAASVGIPCNELVYTRC